MIGMLRAVIMGATLLTLLSAGGCVARQPDVANTSTAPAATPAPSATPTSKANADYLPLTLPVLDAFYAYEPFAEELKAELQLTDEQVDKLRRVARQETVRLRETESDGYKGTTAAARARATEKIKEIIGEEKTAQLAALVRRRWGGDSAAIVASMPNAVPQDTRIIVNAPAYRMDLFESGRLVKSYKIGIGYPEFPLPTGLRKADTIIFNPTWTPPDEPWVEQPGRKIQAGSRLNPLGLLKIPIGLPSLIHGGKAPAKLGGFASHGCVGLTDPQAQEFALWLAKLGGVDLTEEEVKEYAENRTETREVKLATPVPVELRYETIVAEDGRLHIYRDVYDRGTNTEESLRATLTAHGVESGQLSADEEARVRDALQQMARGSSDQPSPDANENKNAHRNRKPASGRVTRAIKGPKEMIVEIAALKGKGYPAPVDLNAGGAAEESAAGQRK
jgi:lipoprotein-anchoring transpeptidase ErfK/SrfK